MTILLFLSCCRQYVLWISFCVCCIGNLFCPVHFFLHFLLKEFWTTMSHAPTGKSWKYLIIYVGPGKTLKFCFLTLDYLCTWVSLSVVDLGYLQLCFVNVPSLFKSLVQFSLKETKKKDFFVLLSCISIEYFSRSFFLLKCKNEKLQINPNWIHSLDK